MSLPLPLIINTDGGAGPSLQKVIDTNINDNTNQEISAKDVRDTLLDITKSTYGLKTIWAGFIYINTRDCDGNDSRGEWNIWQQYYDPNYFFQDHPNPVDPYRRLIVIDNGTNVTQPIGDFVVGTTSETGGGTGLTVKGRWNGTGFDSLEVVNPGRGYYSRVNDYWTSGNSSQNDERIFINLSTNGTRPRIRYNVRNTIRLVESNVGALSYEGDWAKSVVSLTLVDGFQRFNRIFGLQAQWTDIVNASYPSDRSQSRVFWPENTTWRTALSGQESTVADFEIIQRCKRNIDSHQTRGYLEIKAPII